MIRHGQVVTCLVRPRIREESAIAVAVVGDQDAGRRDAGGLDLKLEASALLKRLRKLDVQAVIFVRELQRLACGFDSRDSHALAPCGSGRWRGASTAASTSAV